MRRQIKVLLTATIAMFALSVAGLEILSYVAERSQQVGDAISPASARTHQAIGVDNSVKAFVRDRSIQARRVQLLGS